LGGEKTNQVFSVFASILVDSLIFTQVLEELSKWSFNSNAIHIRVINIRWIE